MSAFKFRGHEEQIVWGFIAAHLAARANQPLQAKAADQAAEGADLIVERMRARVMTGPELEAERLRREAERVRVAGEDGDPLDGMRGTAQSLGASVVQIDTTEDLVVRSQSASPARVKRSASSPHAGTEQSTTIRPSF